MKYAIVQYGGKQLKITEGDSFKTERQKDTKMDVLYYTDGKTISIGTPILKDIKVTAKITEEKRDRKIRVARFKSKSRYSKEKSHRQPISIVKIEKIGKATAKKTTTTAKKTTSTKSTGAKKTK